MINPTLFNITKNDYDKPSLFLGQDMGLFDNVNEHYPEIMDIYEKLRAQDWWFTEIDLSSCNAEFKSCDKSTYDMMLLTLKTQWLMDSMVARTIAVTTAPFVTSSELYGCWSRIGENECLIDGTEILTTQGWVDLGDVTYDHHVAQYAADTGEITFVKPLHILEKQYDGVMYEYLNDNKHFHQVVTPGHRMFGYSLKNQDHIIAEAKDFEYNKKTNNDHYFGVNAGVKRSGSVTNMSDLERLLMAIQADGSVSGRYTGEVVGTLPVWFSFSKQRKIDRLHMLCENLNIPIRELTGQAGKGNVKAKRTFKIDMPAQYSGWLKNFKWVTLEDKTSQWCEEFLAETILWDGHKSKNCGIINTTSKEVAEITQAVATLAGYRTNLRVVVDERRDTYSDCWRMTWKDYRFTSGQVIKRTEKSYSGMVRCVTVPTGLFVCRYNNRVSITGNCVHALTYSQIVRNSFDDPSVVIADTMELEEAMGRIKATGEAASQVHEIGCRLTLGEISRDDPRAYDAILLYVVTVLCIERLQFMASFAVTFAIGDSGQFLPIAKLIQKICSDELECHVELDKAVLRRELATARGKETRKRLDPQIRAIVEEVLEFELWWCEYLFSEGRELVGMSLELLQDWVLFCARDVYEFLEIETDRKLPETNPIPWIESWLKNDHQPSPQEEKPTAYMLGAVKDTAGSKVFEVDL